MESLVILVLLVLSLFAVPTNGSEGSQFLLQCTNFTQHQLESINLARGVCGLGCLLTASFVLLLLLLSKAYKTTLQRLFIYLTIMTVLLETCMSIQLEHYFQYSNQQTFCSVLGFFSEYIGSVTYTFTNEISIYLVYVVYSTLKGRKTLSQLDTGCLSEWFMLGFAVIFPLLYTWVPFISGNYGLNGATCWIKTLDKNCTHSGLKDQLVIMSARYFVYAVIVIATIALVIVYCRMAYKIKTPRIRKLLRQTLFLSTAIVVSITLLTLLSLAYVIASFTMTHNIYSLWLANAAGIPFSMLLVPVIFLFYVRNVNAQANISFSRCCCRSNSSSRQSGGTPLQMDEPVVRSEFPNSNPTSNRESAASITQHNFGYTGEFTVITVSASTPRNEGDPLVNTNHLTGYNATNRNAE